jgi:RES domain
VPRYDEAFWDKVLDGTRDRLLMGTLERLVENQEQKVTLSLTDSLEEHDVLEALLEASKPRPGAHPRLARLDYLLRTPWRYPPLPWGSRFGRRFEPSLFYGALSHEALFAEAAYYRFVFLAGMQTPFRDRVISQFTVFEAAYRTEAGRDLADKPFDHYEAVLRHPADYTACQALGSALRRRGVEAVTYLSARTSKRCLNVALFSPTALRSRKHRNPRPGLAEVSPTAVNFRFGGEVLHFERAAFLVDGALPVPAA